MPTDSKGAAAPRPGLRERKKAQSRSAIAETAKTLFDQHGFHNVTIAEIADAANVSVKTLFNYFPAKEDLLFSDENEFRDQILDSVRNRKPGESALDGLRHVFEDVVSAQGYGQTIEELEGLRRSFDEDATLLGRLTLMWDRYETALAALLREELSVPQHDPTPRLVAAQLISVFRVLTSEEVRQHLHSFPPKARRQALENWIQSSISVVGNGVRGYCVRPTMTAARKASST